VKIDPRALVVIDPETLGGDSVFRGTRVPVHLIAAMQEQGVAAADILEAYPHVTPEMIELAPVYARRYPLRRVPRTQPWRDRPPLQRCRMPLARPADCSDSESSLIPD